MDKLKPSELLRLGAQQVKHTKNSYFEYEGDRKNPEDAKVTAACALGMIAVACAGSTNYKQCCEELSKVIDRLRENKVGYVHVEWLNDEENKTPEEISRYLEDRGA